MFLFQFTIKEEKKYNDDEGIEIARQINTIV